MDSTLPASTWRLGYRPALDGLRGVAVLLVMAWHANLPISRGGGWMGVTIFFVLSGFLITRLLIEEHDRDKHIAVGAFYLRRARRLLPALVVLVIASAVFSGRFVSGLWALSYVGNWANMAGADMWPLAHTWSLAIEEQFYLVWPLAVGLVATRRSRWAVPLLVMGIVTVNVIRYSVPELHASIGTDTRADALMLGALAAVAVGRVKVAPTIAAGAAGLLIVLMQLEPHPFGIRFGLTLAPPLIAVLLLGILDMPAPRWLRSTGRISYGLYLWHYAPMMLLGPLIDPWPLRAIVLFSIAFALAGLSWRFVERPFLRRPARHARVDLALEPAT